jgi:ABC-type lipopolysaccharide export system ATPase subunit
MSESLAHRAYILESGHVLLDGAAPALLASAEVKKVPRL